MAHGVGERVEQECLRAAERLATVFATLPAAVVTEVVRLAERDLRGQVGPEALAELLERLAAHRLAELVESAAPWTGE